MGKNTNKDEDKNKSNFVTMYGENLCKQLTKNVLTVDAKISKGVNL